MTFLEAFLIIWLGAKELRGWLMQRLGTPLQCPELNLNPEKQGGIQLSEDMQQVLSLLTGFSKNERILVKASPVGALRTTASRIIDIVHITGSGANDTVQGSDVPCSEVMCMGHPDNTGKVWVRSLTTATVNNSWPLAAGEVINISVDNYRDIQGLIVVDGEKLICAIA